MKKGNGKKKNGTSSKVPAKIKNYVQRQLDKQLEFKYLDTQVTGTVGVLGSINDMTVVGQGDTDILRDGDKIYLKSIQIKGTMTEADVNNAVRIIMFQWLQNNNAAAPALADILQSTGAYGIISPYYHDGRNLFTILADKVIVLAEGAYPYKVWKLKPKLKYVRREITFNAGATTGSNHIYVLVVTDSGAAADPTVTYQCRVQFTDA